MTAPDRPLLTLPADPGRHPRYRELLSLAVDDAAHDADHALDPSPRRDGFDDQEVAFYVQVYTMAWWAFSGALEAKRTRRAGVWPVAQEAA